MPRISPVFEQAFKNIDDVHWKEAGYNLREIIDHIDELRFRSQKEKHELSQLV